MTTKDLAERDKIRERINKLLALAARPGTPAEGIAARARAQVLAERYGFRITKKKPIDTANLLVEYLRKVEREDVEKQANKDAAEAARKRTSRLRYWQLGYTAGVEGHVRYPFKRRVVFGVNIFEAWSDGWHAGQKARAHGSV